MNLLILILKRTVGQKIVMGLTGLGIFLFVLVHMLGNLWILKGAEAYNTYAFKLHNFLIFEALEIGIFLSFWCHIILGALITIKNKRAKRGSFAPVFSSKNSSLLHRSIVFQAIALFAFLGFHLYSFKFGTYYETVIEGEKTRDIFRLVEESFQSLGLVLFYTFSLLFLFIHLLRGFTASFKSLGVSHPSYISLIDKIGWFFSVAITVGFLIPVWKLYLF